MAPELISSRMFGLSTMLSLLIAGLMGTLGYGQSSDPDERMRSAGLPGDPEVLLALLQKRALLAANPKRLQELVAHLGADSFSKREAAQKELKDAGPIALPLLGNALRSTESESVRRARDCIESARREIELQALEAALPRIAAAKSANSVTVLLNYFPYASNDGIAAALAETLTKLALPGGRPIKEVYAALKDRQPARRAVALYLLDRARPPEKVDRFLPYLEDPHAAVRLEAALAVVQRGETSAVPVLIALLKEARLSLAWRAEGCLRRIAGGKSPLVALQGTTESRRRSNTAWRTWWERNQMTLDLREGNGEDLCHRLIVVADLDEGRILAFGFDGKERWRLDGCSGPVDVQILPSGRLLIAENHSRRVTERDLQGHVLWEIRTEDYPLSCWRRPNGNTCIATRKALREIDAEGREVWKFTPPGPRESEDGGPILCARGLSNDYQIVLLQNAGKEQGGQLILFDEFREQIRAIAFTEPPDPLAHAGLTCLPTGHFLISVREASPIVELNHIGHIAWKWERKDVLKEPITAVCSARLSNGHTLVCDWNHFQVTEIRLDGRVVKQYPVEGRPSCVKVLP